MTELKIGDLVRLKSEFMKEKVGTRAVVYDTYDKGGACIITENGVDIGGFSYIEQYDHLELIKSTDFQYMFSGVIRLRSDWDNGKFEEAFA